MNTFICLSLLRPKDGNPLDSQRSKTLTLILSNKRLIIDLLDTFDCLISKLHNWNNHRTTIHVQFENSTEDI